MARFRVKQKVLFFHAEHVHARNNQPKGTLFRTVLTQKSRRRKLRRPLTVSSYGRL
jgi:hypothetical protein